MSHLDEESAAGEVLFGDSTPFPHGLELLEIARAAAVCASELVQAQAVVDQANADRAALVATAREECHRLDVMLQALGSTMTAFQVSRSPTVVGAAEQAALAVRAIVEQARAEVNARLHAQLAARNDGLSGARALAAEALERFLMRHDLPDTALTLRLELDGRGYQAEATVATPFGVRATFALGVDETFSRPRRVQELAGPVTLHRIAPGGVFSSRLRKHKVTLSQLTLTELEVGQGRARVVMRPQPSSPHGWQLEVEEGDSPRATLSRLGGREEETGLADEDLEQARALSQALVEASCGLALERRALTAAFVDDMPLGEHERPGLIAQRMVAVVAPILREIAARSAAPDELILRRARGGGRREEVHLRRSVLHELVEAAPLRLRPLLEPLELEEVTHVEGGGPLHA